MKLAFGFARLGLLFSISFLFSGIPSFLFGENMSVPLDADIESYPEETVAIFYRLHPEGETEKVLNLLEKNQKLTLTLIFPPHYFEQESRKDSVERFRALQSSGQIEIALSLDNEPPLPLLGGLKIAGQKVSNWGIDFAWPEDISAQIARGSSLYQKQWGGLPYGFIPPYFALSDPVVQSLQRFRLNWTLGKPAEQWGFRYYGGMALMISPIQPDLNPEETRNWEDKLLAWAVEHPFVFIDAGQWEDPRDEFVFLSDLSRLVQTTQSKRQLRRAADIAGNLDPRHKIPEGLDVFRYDFSPWLQSNQQKVAWQALAEARKTVELYKDSGRANLQRLDAAFEEIYLAESGPFLLNLGRANSTVPVQEKNFLATLSNTYRLTNTPIPENFSQLFSKRSRHVPSTSKNADPDRPFFLSGPNRLAWNDDLGDDFGGGKFTYPVGRYPKGAFDLAQFAIQWDDDEVTFTAAFSNLPKDNQNQVLPLIDVYLDVNRLADAGNSLPLKGRNTVVLSKEAAWEYALTWGPVSGSLYQSVPGGEPRRVKPLDVQFNSASNSMSVSFSRKDLRGEPEQWRMSVGVMGTLQKRKDQEGLPVAVLSSPSDKTFGGALSGSTAPPYIDLLAPTVEDQINLVQNYEKGRKIYLPYVEVQ